MLKLISISLIIYNIYIYFNAFKKNPIFLKKVYFSDLKDYIPAFFMVLMVSSLLFLLKFIKLPSFFSFSWLNLFGVEGMNILVSPFLIDSETAQQKVPVAEHDLLYTNMIRAITLLMFVILYLVLIAISGFIARDEERIFRYYYLSKKERIKRSFLFGFAHMIVGVPVYVALILTLIGWIFSVRYFNAFSKKIAEFEYDENFFYYDNAHNHALNRSTSLHAKYNFVIFTICFICLASSFLI